MKDLFETLRHSGIQVSPDQEQEIKRRVNEVLEYVPRIGVFGKTGVGKSSLCNALFGHDVCPISDVEACTRNVQEELLSIDKGGKGIKLVDVPGVGESGERDVEYGALYARLLPELDLILWVLKGDDRAFTTDENFYKNIVKPHMNEGKPFFFVLNQVDKIEPYRQWDDKNCEPGPEQLQNIQRKVDYVADRFGIAASKIIPVSANEKYHLTRLVDEFIRALPAKKKITTFNAVQNEFQSEATGEHVKKSFLEVVKEIASTVVGTAVDFITDVGHAVVDFVGDKISSFFDIFR